MKSNKFSQGSLKVKKQRSRSLNASQYFDFAEVPKHRVSQASIVKTEGKEIQRRLLFYHKTVLIDQVIRNSNKQQKNKNFKEKMFEIDDSRQRRLSCSCNECGKRSTKIKKFHNVYQKQEQSSKELWSSLILQQQQQSQLTISTKSLKSTTTLLSIPDISPKKQQQKIESPLSKKYKQNQKLVSPPLINLKPYLYESPQKKITNLQTEQTQLILKPISLRSSAPNLETFDYSSKNSSPRRGKSNQNYKLEQQVQTARNLTKRMLQICYLKPFSGISSRNTCMNTQKKEQKY
ncbi:unnamed protein product [Paramecium pentaurelia]|uniref:Uncharacterized protein n=1 Tax=Paramecium pentaurelia TaxID=43138 RepID=A0A8S1VND2_9CILI|nr:unnamed protein product [Paramecium pentaurelia]